MSNHKGAGGAKSKEGQNVPPLNRPAGMSQAVRAVEDKTRSRYRGSSKHYHYEGCTGYGNNENMRT